MKPGTHSDRSSHDRMTRSRYCGTRARLPVEDYVVREKYLRRVRSLLEDPSSTVGEREILYGIVNVGEDEDEIWIEKGLSEPEKRFVVIHELVHGRRQLSGEDFPDEALEEKIVELEAIARTDPEVLDGIPNGLAFRLLHDFLTVRFYQSEYARRPGKGPRSYWRCAWRRDEDDRVRRAPVGGMTAPRTSRAILA